MGAILNAICTQKCGFKKNDIYFGAGMSNFITICDIPAINKKTGEFCVKNYFQKSSLPKHIVFYDDPEMYEGEMDALYSHQWGDVYLKVSSNLCPKCGAFSLEFRDVGRFD
jgi:hypothetical protein